MGISENVANVLENIEKAALRCGRNPSEITLVAATKVQSCEAIREAIRSGVKVCGENRVQEMMVHQESNAYEGARLDFIGHLQTNKVKQVVGSVGVIHSVGSERLLLEIGKTAEKMALCQDILLEVNIGNEDSKTGFSVEDFPRLYDVLPKVAGVNIRGLMAIPPRMEDTISQEKIFERLYKLYIDFSEKMVHNYREINCLSMGMSDDYELAIGKGSTMVRVGTALFGSRA